VAVVDVVDVRTAVSEALDKSEEAMVPAGVAALRGPVQKRLHNFRGQCGALREEEKHGLGSAPAEKDEGD
jgi:hypothetical protein